MAQYGSYEWELPNFLNLPGKCTSGAFETCAYSWRLTCYPKGEGPASQKVSLFLQYLGEVAPNNTHIPFELIIKNHKDTSKDFRAQGKPFTGIRGGLVEMLSIADVSVDSGYLRNDGTLCVRAEIGRKPKRQKVWHNVGNDLLDLLEQPGGTSDITITAGGRSFQLHRAILAARCKFFKTMFASNFKDGSSREVPLPDANPDALNLLLRFIYGGVLECSTKLLRPTMELADRLLLPEVWGQLEPVLVDEVGPRTIVEDLLWAERCGHEALLRILERAYVQKYVWDVSAADIKKLAECSPDLVARLHTAMAESMKLKR